MSRARDLANGINTLAPLASPDFTGTVDLTGTTVNLDNDQISGDKVSGGTIGAGTFDGTIGSSATLTSGGIFKCIKQYHAQPVLNPGEFIGNSSNPWTKKSGGSQSWVDVGTDFNLHNNGQELEFPITGMWQIGIYCYFYKNDHNQVGRNMEFTPIIYNGSSWVGLDYLRVGENPDRQSGGYTRGGGTKTVFINVQSTSYRIRIQNQTTLSSHGIYTGGELTFLHLSGT